MFKYLQNEKILFIFFALMTLNVCLGQDLKLKRFKLEVTDQYGYLDKESGAVVIQAKFKSANAFKKGVAKVKLNCSPNFYFIDQEGNCVLDCINQYFEQNEVLESNPQILIVEDCNNHFTTFQEENTDRINSNGISASNFKFSYISNEPFKWNSNLYLVQSLEGKIGIMDANAIMVLGTDFNEISGPLDWNDKLILVKKQFEGLGLINLNGELVLKPSNIKHLYSSHLFNGKCLKIEDFNGNFGLLGINGQLIAKTEYIDVNLIEHSNPEVIAEVLKTEGKPFLINDQNNCVENCYNLYEYAIVAFEYFNNIYIVEDENKLALYDNFTNSMITDFKYHSIYSLQLDDKKVNEFYGNNSELDGRYHYLVVVDNSGEKGLINIQGNTVLQLEYTHIDWTRLNNIKVSKFINGELKYGILDVNGNEIIPVKHDYELDEMNINLIGDSTLYRIITKLEDNEEKPYLDQFGESLFSDSIIEYVSPLEDNLLKFGLGNILYSDNNSYLFDLIQGNFIGNNFAFIQFVDNELALLKSDSNYIFYNLKNKKVVSESFESFELVINRYDIEKNNHYYPYLLDEDLKNNFKHILSNLRGLCYIQKDDKWGVFDLENEQMITEFEFTRIGKVKFGYWPKVNQWTSLEFYDTYPWIEVYYGQAPNCFNLRTKDLLFPIEHNYSHMPMLHKRDNRISVMVDNPEYWITRNYDWEGDFVSEKKTKKPAKSTNKTNNYKSYKIYNGPCYEVEDISGYIVGSNKSIRIKCLEWKETKYIQYDPSFNKPYRNDFNGYSTLEEAAKHRCNCF